jgi:hypothetical protein
VYTCLFGFSEPFNDFAYDRDDGIAYVCFTDDPDLRSDRWEIRLVREMLDPPRASKRVKALPHRFLAGYDWSLYVDNSTRLKEHPRTLFDRYLAKSRSPMVCFRHPQRDCVYDEAAAVLGFGYDEPARVNAQMAYYRHLGYPVKAGLATATLLLRRHNDAAVVAVMERWHQQVLRHSLRDQLSLNPAAWFEGFEIGYLEHDFLAFELLERPVIKGDVRVPRDFDDARYQALNPDVDIDCRKHYLLFGAAEGRSYR